MVIDLRGLALDISAAHKIRASELAAIRKETREMLGEFSRMRAGQRAEIFEMKKEMAGMLGGFRKEREKEAAGWRETISKIHAKGKKEAGRGKKGEKPE